MTLRQLAEIVHGNKIPDEPQVPKIALTFVLNRDFLPGLKALCYSLAAHRTLCSLPILVITEDAALIDEPFVKKIADVCRLVTADEIGEFSSISQDKVDSRLKLDWIPKYTYMKWLMFDDYGFDKLIFIDADIVCLGSCDELLTLEDADLYGCPVFSRDLIVKNGSAIAAEETDAALFSFAKNAAPAGQRLNTGVMVVGKSLLNKDFRRNLIGYAESGSFSVEQAALREFITKRTSLRMKLISPSFNFKHDYLSKVTAKNLINLACEIKLLHFAGAAGKPWEKSSPESMADWIWNVYSDEAQRAFLELIAS